MRKSGQVPASLLLKAKERLTEFEKKFEAPKAQILDPKGKIEKDPEVIQAVQPVEDTSLTKKAIVDLRTDLTNKARQLRQEQANLSNTLHLIDPDKNCIEIVDQILSYRKQIEGIYTRLKLIDRGIDPEKVESPEEQAENIQLKAKLQVEIRSLTDKKSKLKRKIEDLRASEQKRTAWRIELAETEAKLQDAKMNRDIL